MRTIRLVSGTFDLGLRLRRKIPISKALRTVFALSEEDFFLNQKYPYSKIRFQCENYSPLLENHQHRELRERVFPQWKYFINYLEETRYGVFISLLLSLYFAVRTLRATENTGEEKEEVRSQGQGVVQENPQLK